MLNALLFNSVCDAWLRACWYPPYLLQPRRYAEPAGVAEVALFCDTHNRVWYVAVLATGFVLYYTLPGRLTHTSPCTSEDIATLDYVAQT